MKKRRYIIIFLLCFISSYQYVFSNELLINQGKIKPNQKLINEVKQRERNEAHALWWGFDPEDATEILQSAIDSGAQKIIIDNIGKPWIISKTIKLHSNQEIVFEKGVIIEAKQGSFLGKTESLFEAYFKKNITLIGYGATLRMKKLDYTKPPYEKAEWRHILSIRSCENIKIYGLTLASGGGDGIYLGVAKEGTPCKNVHIKDVVCIDNYRQGISVISAENLLIENIIMKETSGTPPMAGIDFEPNQPTEILSNITLRNCISQNNSGAGFAFYLENLNINSQPISIRLENCKAIGNLTGVWISSNNKKESAVKGIIEFVDCVFEENKGIDIFILQKNIQSFRIKFLNCLLKNSGIKLPFIKLPFISPIIFLSSQGNTEPIGGVEFINCEVIDKIERLPITYLNFAPEVELKDITGTIKLIHDGIEKEYKITDELINKLFTNK